ncbi:MULTISPECIES: hypothetical protein [unclassified Streptomyces]|uniref:hypothetical protein n=1 Tax=unclassified Streptomyces TaxID=2593676 RepID=UPI00344BD841
MSELTIVPTGRTELYRHYSGESGPQPVYIELDLEGARLSASYDSQVGGGGPAALRYGFERQYPVPLLTGAAADRLMESLRPFAERILADWEAKLDAQSNRVAVLGEDARAAEAGLVGLLEESRSDYDPDDLIAVWDLDGAVNGFEAEDHDITAQTTDERLAEIAGEIREGLAQCGQGSVVIVEGLEAYLQGLRDNAASAQDGED